MPWTVKHSFSNDTKANRRGLSRKETIYLWLPAIIDEDTLTEITTLESGEYSFVFQQGRERRQYLTGLYLKAISVLGHSHFHPRDLPLQFRRKMVVQLNLDKQFARINIDGGEKSRIVTAIRSFLGTSTASADVLKNLKLWLESNIAQKESDIPIIVNAAVHYLREKKFELPSENVLQSIAEKVVKQATQNFINMMNDHLDIDEQERIDLLTAGTVLEKLKNPVPKASPNNMAKELQRIASVRSYFPKIIPLASTHRHYLESFAELTRRYTTPEIVQIKKSKRRILMLCYIIDRYAQLLDSTADMAIRIWGNTNHQAEDYANSQTKGMSEIYEAHQEVLKSLLKVIQNSGTAEKLWLGVHHLKTPEEYDTILDDIEKVGSWGSCQHSKIEDYYSSLRRFLPSWYNTIPLISTTLNNSIPLAHTYMKNHDGDCDLPTNDCPTDFLAQPWKRNAIRQYSRTGEK